MISFSRPDTLHKRLNLPTLVWKKIPAAPSFASAEPSHWNGSAEEAAKALRSLIAEYPEIPEPYNNLAVIEAGMGSLEEAVKLLDRALLLNPNFATALKNRGDVYLALALESYEAAAPSLSSNTELQQRLKTLRRLTAH